MIILNVKHWTIISLCLLGAISGYFYGYANVLGQIIIAVLVCLTVNALIEFYRSKKIILSDSAIITGLLISMVAAPNTPWLFIAALSAIAILSKFLIKFDQRTVFNPAALSLLIGNLFFKIPLSWWVDNNHLLTIIAGSILLIKYNQHWKMIFAFLLSLAALISLQAFFIQQPLIDQLYFNLGISFFFAFFMITDPRTSPMIADQFIAFGIIVAIGSFLCMIFYPPATLVGGLLIANLINPYLNRLSLKRIKAKANSTPQATAI